MKDIKSFILESKISISESEDTIIKKLNEKECPLGDDDWYDENDLYSYATVPNIPGFADQFELDYVGKYWALSEELNFDGDVDRLPLTMLPYSYGPGQESLENFDYYKDQWEKGTKEEKSKTIKMIKKFIKENE